MTIVTKCLIKYDLITKKKKSHYILLTTIVNDFQVHSGGGFARVAERRRVRC